MGVVVDTTVLVDLERMAQSGPGSGAGALVGRRLAEHFDVDEELGLAAITASEVLHGVHRASPAHRPGREAFVESVLSIIPVLDFDLLAARAHARLWADLASSGTDVGAHDRLVAATAISLGWRVATANVRHFERIPGLEVVEVR